MSKINKDDERSKGLKCDICGNAVEQKDVAKLENYPDIVRHKECEELVAEESAELLGMQGED